jgi:hypothetical protein
MTAKSAPHHCRKTLSGWQPVSNAARDFHAKTNLGQIVEMQGRRPRHPAHHRKFFAMLTTVADNCEQFNGPDDVLLAIKAATGHGRWIELAGASRPLFAPDSINFASMPQDEFEAFYDASIAAVRRWWLPVGDSEFREAIEAFAA